MTHIRNLSPAALSTLLVIVLAVSPIAELAAKPDGDREPPGKAHGWGKNKEPLPGDESNDPPTISGTPGTSVMPEQLYFFQPTATDPNGDPLTFAIAKPPYWANFDTLTGELTGWPTAADAGSYTGIEISVTDGTNTAALPPFTIDVSDKPNTPPTISGTPPPSVMSNQSYNFRPDAADIDGDVLTFAAANCPPWASLDAVTGALSGSPSESDVGTYTGIEISVTDGQATESLPAFSVDVVSTATGTAVLNWQAPTENVDGSPLGNLAGYRVYGGTDQNQLSQMNDVMNPGVTSYVVDELTPNIWYFAITALNDMGLESDLSNIAMTDLSY